MAIGIPPLPRPAGGDPESMLRWAAQLVDALNGAFAGLGAPAAIYEVQDLAAPRRTLVCDGTATLAEVTEVVGTLVEDLQAVGVITK